MFRFCCFPRKKLSLEGSCSVLRLTQSGCEGLRWCEIPFAQKRLRHCVGGAKKEAFTIFRFPSNPLMVSTKAAADAERPLKSEFPAKQSRHYSSSLCRLMLRKPARWIHAKSGAQCEYPQPWCSTTNARSSYTRLRALCAASALNPHSHSHTHREHPVHDTKSLFSSSTFSELNSLRKCEYSKAMW